MIEIAVVTHPRRYDDALDLAEKLNATISMDDISMGAARNHERAWTWLKDSPEPWSLVLEDDAVVCSDFLEQVKLSLAHAPSPIVSFYLGRGRPPHWQDRIARVIAREEHWIISTEMLHGVAVAIRTELIPDLLTWITDQEPVDEAMSDFAQQNHLEIAYTHPSLVDHRDHGTLMDVHPTRHPDPDPVRRNEIRRAWVLGTRLDWNSSAIAM
jgi:GR25 family glycosyltransferase involved in LPS biosynthesis